MTSKLEQLRAMPARNMATPPKVYAWEQQDGMIVSAVCRAVGVPTSSPILDKAEAFKKKHGTLDGWSPVAKGSLAGDLFRIEREAARQRAEVLAQYGKKPQHITALQVCEVFSAGLDNIAAGRAPNVSAELRVMGNTSWSNTVRAKDTSKLNAAALAHHAEHIAMQTINTSALVVGELHKGTMAASLKKVRTQFLNAQTVQAIEDRVTARIEKTMAAQDIRLTMLEEGRCWKAQAAEMRAAGKGAKAIAAATGQSVNTVKSWVKRNAVCS